MNTKKPQTLITQELQSFINAEVLPLTVLARDTFWQNVDAIINDFGQPKNSMTPDSMASKWGKISGVSPEAADPEIQALHTMPNAINLDDHPAALQAVNSRWQSLYDESNDALTESIKRGRDLLDERFPLSSGSHHDVTTYQVYYQNFSAILNTGQLTGLRSSQQFIGFNGSKHQPTALLLQDEQSRLEIQFDPCSHNGQIDQANIDNIKIETSQALIARSSSGNSSNNKSSTTVDIYRNWQRLLSKQTRLKSDRTYTERNGSYDDDPYTIPGRKLILIETQNSGDMAMDILDTIVMTLCALPDLRQGPTGRNSRLGQMYIAADHLQTPQAFAIANAIYQRIETMLGMPDNSIRICIDGKKLTSLDDTEAFAIIAKERLLIIGSDSTPQLLAHEASAGAIANSAQMTQ